MDGSESMYDKQIVDNDQIIDDDDDDDYDDRSTARYATRPLPPYSICYHT